MGSRVKVFVYHAFIVITIVFVVFVGAHFHGGSNYNLANCATIPDGRPGCP